VESESDGDAFERNRDRMTETRLRKKDLLNETMDQIEPVRDGENEKGGDREGAAKISIDT
jgi:hypothetical protein